jgi:LmbE family N-acetylglucosaminyl deacetylase
MLRLRQGTDPTDLQKVLFLGAHSDDIEIGCGGTVLRMLRENPGIEVSWIVFGAGEQRMKEAQAASELFLRGCIRKTVVVHNFRDGYFPFEGGAIKDKFEELKTSFDPDIVFTHYRDDRHQDHRLISDLTWNTFRDHFILEYEIPKYDGDLGSPNFFVHLDESTSSQKATYLLQAFKSQSARHWFSRETFMALPRLRGMESCSPGNYAEGYYCRKIVW